QQGHRPGGGDGTQQREPQDRALAGDGPRRDERRERQQNRGDAEPRPRKPAERPADVQRYHLCHFISVTRRKIGRYIATTRPPTTTPRNTIMMGSSRDVRAVTAVSTSSS